MGRPAALQGLSPGDFTDEKFGVPTMRDILTELEKPGRDPRPEFKTATFHEGIESMSRSAAGHDAGRRGHQRRRLRGLRRYRRPSGRSRPRVGARQQVRQGSAHVVKPGQIVTVRVMEVDVKRQRIALTHAARRCAWRSVDGGSGSRTGRGREGRRPHSAAAAPAGVPACSSASARAERHDGHGLGAGQAEEIVEVRSHPWPARTGAPRGRVGTGRSGWRARAPISIWTVRHAPDIAGTGWRTPRLAPCQSPTHSALPRNSSCCLPRCPRMWRSPGRRRRRAIPAARR